MLFRSDEEDLAHVIIYYGIEEAERTYKQVKSEKDYEVLITSESLMNMAKALRTGGRRLEKSNEVLKFMERNFPLDNVVQIELAKNFIELKKLANAKECLKKILKVDKENKEALELLQKISN